ncbi:phosphoribosyltransferase family protein [Vulcanisaeta souniana]|uniref:Adenine phosphoribosyltransferase n=1 Tax=Vulcanisaeta souniana JCM 11219 TaxID=1293586 RepID=A0A830E1E0_9CREN|nr:phosphoribosyltransferase family protein [Vulcanisaeta souniana]BDR93420.1 adenine phosphoribosyltransferase [Vulcanisaeta souniana JCM 11219]GGI76985.1 adenine phosphoribosyltransferase [Vulcanisaeta souniana JCM 11219]
MKPGLRRVIRYDGKSSYEIRIAGLTRELPIVSIGIINIEDQRFKAYIASDAELVLSDVEFISVVSRELAKHIAPFSPEVIAAPEAKAIAITYEVSRRLGIAKFIIARKGIKAYMSSHAEVIVNSITTGVAQRLVLDDESIRYVKNKRTCIIDDVVSTGSTIRAIENLIGSAGGNIVCRASVWLEGPWIDDDWVIHIGELPIFIEQVNDKKRIDH